MITVLCVIAIIAFLGATSESPPPEAPRHSDVFDQHRATPEEDRQYQIDRLAEELEAARANG